MTYPRRMISFFMCRKYHNLFVIIMMTMSIISNHGGVWNSLLRKSSSSNHQVLLSSSSNLFMLMADAFTVSNKIMIFNQNNIRYQSSSQLISKHSSRHLPFVVSSSSLLSSSSSSSTTTPIKDDEIPSTSISTELCWTTDRVRSTFINYFIKQHEHIYVKSSNVVPYNDPTLLFTNSGMNQFKLIFLGQIDPLSPISSYTRVVNSQKCIRAGGKHNDLDDVGKDTYHHTFFEMLGTWSFNNAYSKQYAINAAWDILINIYQLDQTRIYATYFEGNDDIPPDHESKEYWLQYLPETHVIASNAKDNFWEMGDTGPCGPCTEIHYDRIGGGRDASSFVNHDDPNVIEIWNIVFIQYQNTGNSLLQQLPSKHIDTGMGLERLVSILQNQSSNYNIDCFTPIFNKIQTMTNIGPYTGNIGINDINQKDTAYRVIADHIRTLCFAIADGAIPNNDGRGYVLRRIVRRAIRYGQQILLCEPGFLTKLIPTVIDTFGKAYPELYNNIDPITETIIDEEQSFSTMLQRGIKYFNDIEQTDGTKIITGEQAFFLYDTLGFPIDLTEIMANEANIDIDMNGFYIAMEEQKVRSRQAQKLSKLTMPTSGNNDNDVNDNDIDMDYINRVLMNMELIAEQTVSLSNSGILPTDDAVKHEHDVPNGLPATVLAIFTEKDNNDYQFVKHDDIITSYQPIGLVLDKSSFYSEGGGQVSDIGTIDIIDHNTNKVIGTFQVNDVQVYGGYVLHKGYVINDGTIKVGQIVNCQVNYNRRQYITPNHSMTHVLNSALRSILGNKIDQRGSLCNTDKLRFDFSYKQAMTINEIQQVEVICQNVVKQKQDVTSMYVPLNDAMKIDGVRAVFGEVYPDPVRVVTIGTDTSIEFCGGTHIQNTRDVEAFVIIEETAVAKGIRRITAVTKDIAKDAIQNGISLEEKVSSYELLSIDTTPNLNQLTIQLRKELESITLSAVIKMKLRIRIEALQKKLNDYNKKLLQKRIDICINDMKDIILQKVSNNEQILVLQVDIGIDTKASQTIINTIKSLAPDMAFLGISIDDDDDAADSDPDHTNEGNNKKVFVFAYVPDSILNTQSLKANEWINKVLLLCENGRGGGKPSNAQGQGMIDNNNMIQTMLLDAEQYAQTQLSTK